MFEVVIAGCQLFASLVVVGLRANGTRSFGPSCSMESFPSGLGYLFRSVTLFFFFNQVLICLLSALCQLETNPNPNTMQRRFWCGGV